MIRYAVAFDIAIDLVLILAVVAQNVEYLCHGQVGQVRGISSGGSPPLHSSTMVRTGVRVPLMVDSPLNISSSLTTWRCCVDLVIAVCDGVPFTTCRYSGNHGMLGPAAKRRDLIVPNNAKTILAAPESGNAAASRPGPSPDPAERSEQPKASPAEQRHPRNYLWSELMKRVFAADVLTCDRCGGPLRILATIRPPEITRKILDHLGLPSRPPPLAPAALQELPFAFE